MLSPCCADEYFYSDWPPESKSPVVPWGLRMPVYPGVQSRLGFPRAGLVLRNNRFDSLSKYSKSDTEATIAYADNFIIPHHWFRLGPLNILGHSGVNSGIGLKAVLTLAQLSPIFEILLGSLSWYRTKDAGWPPSYPRRVPEMQYLRRRPQPAAT